MSLQESFYIRCLLAKERALKLARHPSEFDKAMSALRNVNRALAEWDKQQTDIYRRRKA